MTDTLDILAKELAKQSQRPFIIKQFFANAFEASITEPSFSITLVDQKPSEKGNLSVFFSCAGIPQSRYSAMIEDAIKTFEKEESA